MAKGYFYTTIAGDTFDSISLDFYNDERKSSVIIQANLQYRLTLIFSGGQVLFIPFIDVAAASVLPPWKRGD